MSSNAEKKILGEGRYLRLVEENRWEYAERKKANGVVGIAAVTDEGNMLLVEQYRVTMRGPVIELPAGLVGDEDEDESDFAEAARRELLEETGYAAREMARLTEGPSSSGLSTEVVTFFLARGLERRHAGGGVGGENIKVHEVPLEKVEEWLDGKVRSGVHLDPRIFIGLYFIKKQ